MKLFGMYLRQRWKGIVIFVLFCGIFSATFALYHLPLGAVAYPALLCLGIGLVFIGSDFYRVLRRHGRFEKIRKQLMLDHLPEPVGIEEADYRQILDALQEELRSLAVRTSARYQDMMDYYSMWVHQIKTPIASMRLTLQNEDTALSRKLSSDLFRIEQYVEMVLAFLRLDSESTDYVFQEYSLDGIVKKSVSKFAAEFIGRKIRLEYEPIGAAIVTDEKWLAFVIEQVLANALKYTREGSIKIYLQPEKVLCIEDTGIGIAPEDLPRIFEKGYTGYNGRLDRKASGIGLYLCKKICGNLGASISVVSELDRGTTVKIDLSQRPTAKE